ncbi:flavin reductase family protein [Sporosarcina pasteurii]|uniref:p-hydroxyphenylacetate 3-hydroxylase, reductase component n=1 Tax=Sporosarcina pasteurii TaxID=1474 RepID=A0A380CEU7_SPOPA|nr:flavin reductase family protein [Sporosarcina pasteurii]MDS9473236.1 flavin reductase family protein [Sporosarcina pasteurii]QBQ06966.1 flavin reductase [Sporosarcina pasteurii]SUJ17823.1 p-hydroxyphenylacetate 3-hydroxylase, reductase component [Sporosarcina pasteurii]
MDNKIESFKSVMGNYPTGVTVVTAFNEQNEPMGLTVNSFASVSLDPLLILWSIDKNAGSYEDFLKVERFSVNILASDQGDICQLFASRVADRFAQCEWEKSELSLPVLKDSLATLQCKVHQKVEAGDHTIMIGEVVDIQNNEKDPLLYHKRTFGQIPKTFYPQS